MPWCNQVLLSREEVGCSALHNLNVPALCFHQVKEWGRLRNCLWDTKSCSSMRWGRHKIVCPLKFSHRLLLPLSHNPQISSILLSQSQDLAHPGDEAVLPGRHLARVRGKVLVIAVVLQVTWARVESKVLSWMMVVTMTSAHDDLGVECQFTDQTQT